MNRILNNGVYRWMVMGKVRLDGPDFVSPNGFEEYLTPTGWVIIDPSGNLFFRHCSETDRVRATRDRLIHFITLDLREWPPDAIDELEDHRAFMERIRLGLPRLRDPVG